MRWSKEAMTESFFLSNMSPQIGPGMNRGIWKDLEEHVRQWAISRGEVYIFTGPIYAKREPVKTIGDNNVVVPTGFYKIVFDPVQVEAIAFIMPNKALNAKDLPNHIVSIDEVEAQTGMNFLSRLTKTVQRHVELNKASGLWE